MPPKKTPSAKAKTKPRYDTSEDELDQSPPPPTKKGKKNKRQDSDSDQHEHKKPKNGKTTNNGDKKAHKWTEGDKERLARLGSDVDDATLGEEFPERTIRSIKMMKTKMAPDSTKKEKKEKHDKKEKKPARKEKAAVPSKKKEPPEVIVDKRATTPKKQAKKKEKAVSYSSSLSSDNNGADEKVSSDDDMSDIASHHDEQGVSFESFKGELMSEEESHRAFDIYFGSPIRGEMWGMFKNWIESIGSKDLKNHSRQEWEWAFSTRFADYVNNLPGNQSKDNKDAGDTSSTSHDKDDDKDVDMRPCIEVTR